MEKVGKGIYLCSVNEQALALELEKDNDCCKSEKRVLLAGIMGFANNDKTTMQDIREYLGEKFNKLDN